MKRIVNAAVENLLRAEPLLKTISKETYTDTSAGPYNSSIGAHLRHILDIFLCIIKGLESRNVDLTDRKRGTMAEKDLEEALKYLYQVIAHLQGMVNLDPNLAISIVDDLGQGRVKIASTLASGLCQAHSHAIHHFACIAYLLYMNGENIPDGKFGYNPTTPIIAGQNGK